VSMTPGRVSSASDRSHRAGILCALTSSLGAGLATVVGKWNLEAVSPLLLSCMIFTTSTVVLSVGYLPFRGLGRVFRLTRRGWFWMIMFTISSWVAILSFWAGVQRMDPSLAAFLNRAEVPIAILLGIIFLKERFTSRETLGALLSIAGIVIMKLTLRFEYSTGFWLVLLGSLFFGITEFISKIAVRHVEPIALVYVRGLFLAVAYWAVLLGGGHSLEGLDRVWVGIIALGILGPIVSRMMYLLALKRLELSKVAVISQSQPIFVIVTALLVLGQLPTLREMTGGLFVLAGCVLMIGVGRKNGIMARISQLGSGQRQ